MLKVFSVFSISKRYAKNAVRNGPNKSNANERGKPKKVDKKLIRSVEVNGAVTVKQLSTLLDRPVASIYDCIRYVMPVMQFDNNENTLVSNFDLIKKVVEMSGCRVKMGIDQDKTANTIEQQFSILDRNDDCIAKRVRPTSAQLVTRAPIVTIMGHVDHGKTTLLDSLRNTNVAKTESGLITQHIGAFNTRFGGLQDNKRITFLDTPGHAAFMSMRERGAKLTDIVVIVIACDDGIMPQTIESIRLAQESKCELLIALNKVDKMAGQEAQVRIRKIKETLLAYNIQTEDLGGDVQVVEISALKRLNLDLLLDKLWTLAELLQLKGDPSGLSESYVVESYQDRHRGKLATVIVKRGRLRRGDVLVSGTALCRVKQLFDHQLNLVDEAGLSDAVQIMGWKELPSVSDECLQMANDDLAKQLIETRLKRIELSKQNRDQVEINKKASMHLLVYKDLLSEKKRLGLKRKTTLNNPLIKGKLTTTVADKPSDDKIKTLSILIKTDVNGTLEAILNLLDTYDAHDMVKLDVVHFECGQLTQNDIDLATTFKSLIYCFNMKPDPSLKYDESSIKIKYFDIIYKLFDDLKEELGHLSPQVEEEVVIGEASVQKTFEIDDKKLKNLVIGGNCTLGLLDSRKLFKVMRQVPNENDDKAPDYTCIANEAKCKTLKHYKTDVQTIKKGSDFGLLFESQTIDIKQGDKIVCYEKKWHQSKIDWDLGF